MVFGASRMGRLLTLLGLCGALLLLESQGAAVRRKRNASSRSEEEIREMAENAMMQPENFNENNNGDQRFPEMEDYEDLENNWREQYGGVADELRLVKPRLVDDWPTEPLNLGQVGGVAVDSQDKVHVLHRGVHTWNRDSFDENNTYLHRQDGPIAQPALLKLNDTDGHVILKWGENLFYMPHGLNVDPEGYVWVTDVALHQVFKFEVGKNKPTLALGKAFESAKTDADTERFCQPTDVAVAPNGDVFVSDGYCASRIMKFDKNGKFVTQFGVGDFMIPHSLTLIDNLDLICVADRENQRIICFEAGLKEGSTLGRPHRVYDDETIGRVYAIDSNKDGLLYGVSVPGEIMDGGAYGFTIDLLGRLDDDVVATWTPDVDFVAPHDIAISPDGADIYVTETAPHRVRKFVTY